MLAVSVHHDVADALTYARFEPVAQRAIVLRTLLEFFACEFRRFAKRNDPRNVLGAGALFALLMSADVLTVQPHAAANVERANAFRRIQLVTRHR